MAGLSLSFGGNGRGDVTTTATKQRLLFLLLAVLWYSSSFLSSSTSKALLSGKKIKLPSSSDASHPPSHSSTTTVKLPPLFPYPVSLTALQFLFVFTFSYLLSSPTVAAHVHRLLGRPAPRSAQTGLPRGLMSTLVLVDGPKLREMMGLSVFNVAGHAMTAAAIQMVPVSTVHTVKALSPLFTVLSYVLFLGLSYPLRTYLSLAPLTIGVIFACSGLSSIEGPRAWLGILLSVGSTVVFVAQNLWSKKLLGHALGGRGERAPPPANSGIKLDKLNILFWSSGVSVLLMLPMLAWTDWPRMYAAAGQARTLSSSGDPGSALGQAAQHAVAAASRDFANVTATTSPSQLPLTSPGSSSSSILFLLLTNGLVHFSQNLLAFSVLALTSPVTYSVASLCKRVFVICFAILWFGQKVTGKQWCGIALTFVGLWLYNDAKRRPSDEGGKGVGKMAGGEGGETSMASREEEAALDFGLDRGSRRRTGILPTSGGAGGLPSHNGSLGGGGSGPIWKGMSNALYGNGSAAAAGAGRENGGQHNGLWSPPVDVNGYARRSSGAAALSPGHFNGHAAAGNGTATSPTAEKGGPKRD